MVEYPQPSPSRRSLQFSLRTAFLLIVMASVGASLWVSMRSWEENSSLRNQISGLKRKLGELDVKKENEDKLHAIPEYNLAPLEWDWRVYVPSGRTFMLNVAVALSTSKESPKTAAVPLNAGSGTVSVRLVGYRAGKWGCCISPFGGPSATVNFSPTVSEPILANSGFGSDTSPGGTSYVEPGQSLELLQILARGAGDNFDGSNDTITVWISEPAPAKSAGSNN